MSSADPAAIAPETDERWIDATYRVRSTAGAIDARAHAIALEQSVEAPLAAVDDPRVLEEVVARVAGIAPVGPDAFDVTIRIAVETTGFEAGQFMSMLFGNSSLHDDIELVDARVPTSVAARFGGPRYGIAGVRALAGVHGRPLTCSALKPQGLAPVRLAAIARTLARAGVDVVKDDHGLADQDSAPFHERVRAVQHAVDEANRETGHRCVYAPSLTGHFGQLRERTAIAHEAGVRMILVAPMVSGVGSLAALAREAGMPILAHPALAGAVRIAPPLILGKLFRLFGADAAIFPNAGGRFAYSPETCAGIVDAARTPWHGLAPMLPVPAGGMTVARVPEMRERYGDDAMLLIGGSLLAAREQLFERAREFVTAVSGRGE